MTHKLGICIPYRNRKEHLDKLIDVLGKYLNKKGIDHGFYVANQTDDKLFNRGSMKNIAAIKAFEDGCDYIAWHDVDMLPNDDTCDYSYPDKTPVHIATKLSKYSWSMGYEEYFGGVVLFTKEQVEKTNGYSNDYWDWGQEDDDLFWRCNFEGYANKEVIETIKDKPIGTFNGKSSYIRFPVDRTLSSCFHRDHTISVLVKTFIDRDDVWLVGDKDRKFKEFPILRKEKGALWGISFNNSRTYASFYYDRSSTPIYNWVKRSENLWTRFTISYNQEEGELYMFMNDKMISNNRDIVREEPIKITNKLKLVSSVGDLIVGFCPHTNTCFGGQIGEIKIYDTYFKSMSDINDDNLILNYDFDGGQEYINSDVIYTKEDVEVIRSILPFRRQGSFLCLPHIDEGFVNGTWFKGETTARNEKRFVTEMQQNKIDYKSDGINNVNYNIVKTINYSDNCKMYNIEL